MNVSWTRTCLIVAALSAATRAQTTQRASTGCSRSTIGNFASFVGCVSLSADGRYAVFDSLASNLVAHDTYGGSDVFVWDRQTCAPELVSVATDGTQGNGSSGSASISADGRWIAFSSYAGNLVRGDTNGVFDVFVHDRQSGATELVSVGLGGAIGNGGSYVPSISSDGRFVAFLSDASNLVANDTNGVTDVFVRDRQTGTTECVSVDLGGVPGNGPCDGEFPAISADGRYVAFQSLASNLVAGDTNGARDVFVRDRQSGTTERVSVDSGGVQGNADSGSGFRLGISADGRYVAFVSLASNLVAGDANGVEDVFVRDRTSGTTERVSVGVGGVEGDGRSLDCAISSDGRCVAFSSGATNLVAGDTNGRYDVFVRDRQAATTELASVSTGGALGNFDSQDPCISGDGRSVLFYSGASNLVAGDFNGVGDVFIHDRQSGTTEIASATSSESNDASQEPAISTDGSCVVFMSNASNIVAGDTNGAADVFVFDRTSGAIERVSVASDGTEAAGESQDPSISADGRYVAFWSYAPNLVAGDTNLASDVFVHDRVSGTTERVSVATGGGQANGDSFRPSISADGRYVAFESDATNLVAGDTNGVYDIFVRDRQNGTTERVSVSTSGTQADNYSIVASISADGRYVAFQSFSTNLVAGDTNGLTDIFLRDRQGGTTQRVSLGGGGVQANGDSFLARISADGRFVAFESNGSNLVPGDTNGAMDVFVANLVNGTRERVSVATSGAQSSSGGSQPGISADGRYVLFTASGSDLVSGDTNGHADVFLRDRSSGTTVRVSLANDGSQGNGDSGTQVNAASGTPSISGDGRFAAFESIASNLVSDDTNGVDDIFLRDRGTTSDYASFCAGDGTVAPCPCGNSGAPGHGCENSSTTGGALLTASGVASLAADSVHLTASGEKPTATSVLLQGALVISPIHYGDGLRCVGGTLKRLYTHTAAGGIVTMPQGADATISAASAAKGDVINAGSTRGYQIYYRDPSTTFCPTPNGGAFNISSAILVSWGT